MDSSKLNYDLLKMQEEKYGFEIKHPTDLNVVYDVHEDDRDMDFAGIVALLPQAKPQRIRSAKAGSTTMHKQSRSKSGLGLTGRNENKKMTVTDIRH